MATIPFVCNPAFGQYNFTYPLAWSNNCEVAKVLSDIPFITVGILVFGISGSFFVFQRVPLSAIWLYFSALLAFVAMILDLGQTIANEMAIRTTYSTPLQLIRASQVLLALSVGFRFLFYWSYAAEPPRRALPSTPRIRVSGSSFLDSSDEPHGGTWVRWGMLGRLLSIGFLAAIVVITALQIVWRVVPQFHRYGNVYATDTALELLASFLLLVKLLLNTISPNSPDRVLVHTFRESLAPICGLLMNIAIGVGNLLYFAFTESTVGRLLQAVEAYTIIIFVAIIALLKHRNLLLSSPFPRRSKRRASDFRLPDPARGSEFRVTPPLVETPRISAILGPATSTNVSTRETLRRSARHSINQVASWMAGKLPRNPSAEDGEEARLWEQGNAEKGKLDTELRASLPYLTEEPKEWAELVHDADASHMSIMSALDAQSAIARLLERSSSIGQIISASQADVTVPLQIGTNTTSPTSVVSNTLILEDRGVPNVAESPVYCLDGIRSVEALKDSPTSLDELLQQQNELDQSIEALKLFSTRASTTSSYSSPVQSAGSAELSRFSSYTSRRTASDVSLSNFPIPPWLTTPMPSLPPSRSGSVFHTRREKRFGVTATPVRQSTANGGPSSRPVISPSPVDMPSTPRSDGAPYSPLKEDGESLSAAAGRPPRFNSGGTQYNVTSFIGGLAVPGGPAPSIRKSSWSTEMECNILATRTGTSGEENSQRTQLIPPSPPTQARLSLHAGYAGAVQGQGSLDDPALVTQRRINQEIIPSLMITPSTPRSRFHASTTAAQDGRLKPTRPRVTRGISSDRGGTERTNDGARRAFERQRPPPIVVQSYSEYQPRPPPAQDAGG